MPDGSGKLRLIDLERVCLDAHRRGEPWPETWAAIRQDLATMIPFDRAKYRRAYVHLLHLATTGDPAGQEPPGSWPADEVSEL